MADQVSTEVPDGEAIIRITPASQLPLDGLSLKEYDEVSHLADNLRKLVERRDRQLGSRNKRIAGAAVKDLEIETEFNKLIDWVNKFNRRPRPTSIDRVQLPILDSETRKHIRTLKRLLQQLKEEEAGMESAIGKQVTETADLIHKLVLENLGRRDKVSEPWLPSADMADDTEDDLSDTDAFAEDVPTPAEAARLEVEEDKKIHRELAIRNINFLKPIPVTARRADLDANIVEDSSVVNPEVKLSSYTFERDEALHPSVELNDYRRQAKKSVESYWKIREEKALAAQAEQRAEDEARQRAEAQAQAQAQVEVDEAKNKSQARKSTKSGSKRTRKEVGRLVWNSE